MRAADTLNPPLNIFCVSQLVRDADAPDLQLRISPCVLSAGFCFLLILADVS